MGRSKEQYSLPFYSRDYFSNNILPIALRATEKLIKQDTPLKQHDDMMIIFIKSGTGKIIINSVEHALFRGRMICIGPFHNFLIKPDKGEELDLFECYINSGAYLYIIACPYYKLSFMRVPRTPLVVVLDEKETQRTEELISELVVECTKSSAVRGQLSFFLIMKLIGVILGKVELHKTDPSIEAS